MFPAENFGFNVRGMYFFLLVYVFNYSKASKGPKKCLVNNQLLPPQKKALAEQYLWRCQLLSHRYAYIHH